MGSDWQRVKAWRQLNPEKYALQQQRKNARRRGGPQAPNHKDSVAKWNATHPEHYREIKRAMEARRRARKRAAVGTATVTQIAARFAFYGNRCAYCGSEENLTVDHVKPLARGGSHWPANLRPACRSCNSRKGTREVMPA